MSLKIWLILFEAFKFCMCMAMICFLYQICACWENAYYAECNVLVFILFEGYKHGCKCFMLNKFI